MKRWMIYGANGYTGRLCVAEARNRGLEPVLAGRNRAQIEQLARENALEARIFDLADAAKAAEHMQDIDAVLHCAGPFSHTAQPMLRACVASKTNYLDITGEIPVFEYVHRSGGKWTRAGIAAIPGVGFDVVPSDCLAAMLKEALPEATRLVLAFTSPKMRISPGTAKTVAEGITYGTYIRRNGRLASIPAGSKTATIPFESGEKLVVAISWGDVSTAFFSTGIPNIEVYTTVKPAQLRQIKMAQRFKWFLSMRFVQRAMQRRIEKKVHGPTESQRAASWAELYGEATNDAGGKAAITLRTPDGYDLTADAAVTAVQRVLEGLPPGAYTPSKAFGSEFVLGLKGVSHHRVE